MTRLRLASVGAVCAFIGVACFLAGVVLMVSSGVDTLIPETGEQGLRWMIEVQDAGVPFLVGAWLGILGGLFLLVAQVGFYDALREAGTVLIIAPVAAIVGMTLVTLSHLVPLAMAYQFAPQYLDATDTARALLAVTANTLTSTSTLTNYVGNALVWGVAVPLYAIAILSTKAVPRWIGWLGIVVAVSAGWLGPIGLVSDAIAAVSSIGFISFFVFVAAAGIAILRRRNWPVSEMTPTR